MSTLMLFLSCHCSSQPLVVVSVSLYTYQHTHTMLTDLIPPLIRTMNVWRGIYVLITSRIHASVKSQFPKVRQTKYTTADLCDCGISVLNHCLLWSKFVKIYLSHCRQWFNITSIWPCSRSERGISLLHYLVNFWWQVFHKNESLFIDQSLIFKRMITTINSSVMKQM